MLELCPLKRSVNATNLSYTARNCVTLGTSFPYSSTEAVVVCVLFFSFLYKAKKA